MKNPPFRTWSLVLMLVLLSALVASSAPAQTAPSSEMYGKPSAEFDQGNVKISVHDVGDLKVIAVREVSSGRYLFLSYVNPSSPFSENEISGFLSEFAKSSSVTWEILDRQMIDDNLRFFLTAPIHAQEEVEKRIRASAGNPEEIRAAWMNLASDPSAHAEARAMLKMIQSQRQIWVSQDSRLVACWSSDGKSLGVGFLPQGSPVSTPQPSD